jgi:glycerate kinase
MRVLVAPDDFKGTFSAPEVAAAIARGLRDSGAEADELPIADGGNGTMDAVVASLGGRVRTARVSDPLGRPVQARWALLPDGRTAVIDAGDASGLWRVAPQERDAWRASTRGTGELILAATADGAQEVLIGVGGSATSDGGRGAVEVLHEAGINVALRVICDVRVSYEDAARVFGPQKGADPETVARLTRRLHELAASAPRDPRGVPMTGAAGGLSGALWAHFGATLVEGAAFVLDTLGFDRRLASADLVVTGEGKLDEQTLTGKAIAEVAQRCRAARVPLHVVAGTNTLDAAQMARLQLAGVREATTLAALEQAGRALAAS